MNYNNEGWVNDYEEDSRNFYNESMDNSPIEWNIRPIIPESETFSDEFSYSRQDLDDVESAACLDDALKAYDNHYSWKEINAGKQSPQYAAKMLLRIKNKFNDYMNSGQRHGIACEIIAMCHAIGRLAKRPPEAGGDRTSLEGLVEITEAISEAQIYAPEEIPLLEQDLRDVAARVESRVTKDNSPLLKPLSGSLLAALDEFDNLPSSEKKVTPFPDIVGKIERTNLNEADKNFAILNRQKSLFPDTASNHKAQNTQAAQPTQTNYSTSIATIKRKTK